MLDNIEGCILAVNSEIRLLDSLLRHEDTQSHLNKEQMKFLKKALKLIHDGSINLCLLHLTLTNNSCHVCCSNNECSKSKKNYICSKYKYE